MRFGFPGDRVEPPTILSAVISSVATYDAGMRHKDDQPARDELAHYLPTPTEIRRECLAIQATWSRAERRKRAPWAAEAERVRFPGVDAVLFETDFCDPLGG